MLSLFYSPHSTSIDNEAGRASGHADVPLSALGQQQAYILGQHYADEKIDAVFHSDLQRATSTAHIAFSHRAIPLIPDKRLREYDYGDMTQSPTAKVEQEFPQRIINPFPNGESALMVIQRVGEFLRSAFDVYDGKTLIVIGHRATRYGIAYWCGNTSVEEIVNTPWEWKTIPIWHYQVTAHQLERSIIPFTSQKDQ